MNQRSPDSLKQLHQELKLLMREFYLQTSMKVVSVDVQWLPYRSADDETTEIMEKLSVKVEGAV